ncbi:hypothetical protein [Flagellimonas sp.]|uniref:hypothetical protein n=1 Tax=Flagellimonas sp. TaxID=2058762 RepID=UPI003BAD4688
MRNILIVLAFLSYFAVQGQVSVTKDGYAKVKKKPIETSLIDSDTINISKSDGIIRGISFADFKSILPFTNGPSLTAGNGINIASEEISVDTSRVIMVDISSPVLGPATIAFGTNAELDALGTPPSGTTRYEWATDGDVAVSGGDMQKSQYDINNDGIVDDAEQLDGLDSSQFVQIDDLTANNGQLTILSDDTNAKGLRIRNNTTGQSSFFWMDDSDHLNIENSNTGARDVHINRNGSGVLRVNGNLVWNSGNDGPGSSLNADLLDNQESSYFLNWLNLTNVPSGLADGDDDTQRTDEEIEDIIGNKVVAGTDINVSYNDTTGETTINSTVSSVTQADGSFSVTVGGTSGGTFGTITPVSANDGYYIRSGDKVEYWIEITASNPSGISGALYIEPDFAFTPRTTPTTYPANIGGVAMTGGTAWTQLYAFMNASNKRISFNHSIAAPSNNATSAYPAPTSGAITIRINGTFLIN